MKYTVITKEWFDRINGNSYCSVRITNNETNEVIAFPFQYGYGSYGEQIASKTLKEKGEQFTWLSEIADSHKIEKCLKRDVIAWGEI